MPSCLVRLTLLLLSVALAAAQQPLVAAAVTRDSHKDSMISMIDAHQHGGKAGMRAIDDLYCDGTTSKQGKKGMWQAGHNRSWPVFPIEDGS